MILKCEAVSVNGNTWKVGDNIVWFDPDWANHADGNVGRSRFEGAIKRFLADREGRIHVDAVASLGWLPINELNVEGTDCHPHIPTVETECFGLDIKTYLLSD